MSQQPQPMAMTGGGVALRREHSNSSKGGLKLGLSLLWLHHKGKSAALAPHSAADAEHGPAKETISAAPEPLSARSGSEELIQPGVDGALGASLSRSRSVSHSVARSRHQRTSSLTLNSSTQAAYPTIIMKSAGGSMRGTTTTTSNNAGNTMNDQTSRGQAQFHVLPIAPAAFERRRKSVATAPTNYASGTKTSPTPSLSARKSAASLERIQAKSDEEIGGIYGWSEEEAARANEEYIRFMKAKGATLA
ncbi:hypothetical protein HDU80_011409 [Chytriomyces hyalinus]|nr:hypothetical protein HDU80_011409 [Chytriomyces hyalinus]